MLKLDPKNVELLNQKQTVLKENIQQTQEKLEQLKKAQDLYIESGGDLNSQKYRNLQREIISTQNQLSKLKAEASNWTKAGNALVQFGNKIKNVSEKLDKLGTTLTTKLTLPIVAMAGATVKSASDFESAFTGVKKTVDGSPEELEKIKKGIKSMAEELPSTTTDISSVAEAAGQLGIKAKDIVPFTKVMINLGNSTNLSANEAATSLARFANVTKMSADDYDKLGSTIVDLGNNFATTEKDITEMGLRLSGAGTQVGLSQSQILSFATALSSVGIEAEMGGSAFSKLMVNMGNAVELGGKKLPTVLKKSGYSLRELQLMSSNNSKNFKKLAGNLGLTSTELNRLINSGASLQGFAEVAGMTADEFSKKWKKDATGAISDFISGLAKMDKKGDNAISKLSELGITEVRLRDTILRATNAEKLFNNALKTGEKAWKDNTALSKEANQRYATLASKVEITKNKLINLATNTGEKLTPTIKGLLDKVNKLIDGFDDLSEEQVQTIAKIALLVATVGPATKVLASFGNVIGGGIGIAGDFAKAMGNVNSGVETAEGRVGTFMTAIKLLKNPVVLTTAAVTALVAAFAIYQKNHYDEITSVEGVTKSLREQKASWEDLKKERENSLNQTSSEIVKNEKLAKELDQIVDKNGKVKKGYESRASYIVKELKDSLGIEINLNNNIIEQYKKIKDNIQKVITVKKAEALLNAYQPEYTEALKNHSKATENLVKLREEYNNTIKKTVGASYSEKLELSQRLEAITKQIGEETSLIEEYGYTIENYEDLQTKSVKGTAEELEKAVKKMNTSWESAKNSNKKSLAEQLLNEANYVKGIKASLQDAEKANSTYQQKILKLEKEKAQERLTELKKSLTEQTSTIEDMSEEEKKAWKELADGNFEVYRDSLSQMPKETKEKIEKITGVIAFDTSVENATKGLATDATEKYDRFLKLDEYTKNKIQKTSTEINNDTKVENSARNLAVSASKGFNNNVNGEKWGKDLVKNVSSGMTNSKSQQTVVGAATKVAGWISNYLHFSLPEKGPLSDFNTSMPDMINLMIRGIKSSKPKLNKSLDEMASDMNSRIKSLEIFQGRIGNQVIDSVKTIFTTPQITFNVQKMDKENLNECFEYINKKFGSSY